MATGFKVGSITATMQLKKNRWDQSVREVKNDQTGLQTGAKKTGGGFKKMGLAMMAAGVVIAGTVGKMIKNFAAFDSAMTQSLAIMGDVSGAMRTEMAEAAKEMSTKTTFAANELAAAYFYLASAGMDAEQSIKALPVVARFAQAGMFNLSTATDLLTDAQTALGLSSKDVIKNQKELTRVSDVLVKANTLANASVQQFAEALTNKAAASLVNVNKEMEEGVAVLAAYADKGIKGTLAGQRLTMMMNGLFQATQLNKDAWDDIGISLFDSAGEMRSIADIIGDLEVGLGDMTTEQKQATLATLGFNMRTKDSILTLMGSSEKIRTWTEDLKKAGGTTEDVANKQLKSFSSQFKLIKNEITNATIEIGEKLAPTISELATLLKDVLIPILKEALPTALTVLTGGITAVNAKFTEMIIKATGARTAAEILADDMIIAKNKALDFRDSLTVLNPTLEELEKNYKANKEGGGAWARSIKEQDEKLAFAQVTLKDYLVTFGGLPPLLAEGVVRERELAEAIYETATSSEDAREKIKAMREELKAGKSPTEALTARLKELRIETKTEVLGAISDLENNIKLATKSGMVFEDSLIPLAKELIKLKELAGQKVSLALRLMAGETEKLNKALKKTETIVTENIQPARDFGEVIISAREYMLDAIKTTDDWQRELANLGSQYDLTALDIQNALIKIVNLHLAAFGIQIPEITLGAADKIKSNFKTIPPAMTIITSAISGAWDDLFGHLKAGTLSFKTAWESIWGGAKNTFFGTLQDMLTRFTTNFVSGIISGATSAGTAVSTLAGGAATLGTALEGLVAGVASILPAIATAIASAASILAAALPEILAVGAAALALYAGFKAINKFLSSSGSSKAMDATNRLLEKIWANTKELRDIMFIDYRQILLRDQVQRWEAGLIKQDAQSNILQGTYDKLSRFHAENIDLLGGIQGYTRRTFEAISSLPKAQHGAVMREPGLVMTHGTPKEHEYILPDSKLDQIISNKNAGSKTINISVNMPSAMEFSGSISGGTFDPSAMQSQIRNVIVPQLLNDIKAGLKKTEWNEALGLI